MHIFRHFFEVDLHIFHETNIAMNSGNVVFLPSMILPSTVKNLILANKITENYNIW